MQNFVQLVQNLQNNDQPGIKYMQNIVQPGKKDVELCTVQSGTEYVEQYTVEQCTNRYKICRTLYFQAPNMKNTVLRGTKYVIN